MNLKRRINPYVYIATYDPGGQIIPQDDLSDHDGPWNVVAYASQWSGPHATFREAVRAARDVQIQGGTPTIHAIDED